MRVENGILYDVVDKDIVNGTFDKWESVTSIGDCAFEGCRSLTSITIPDSVTSIGDMAFDGCSKLSSKPIFVKATNKDMLCRGFQYKLNKVYVEAHSELCKTGFHFCTNAFDLLNYYAGNIGEDVRFFEVEANDISEETQGDSKKVCRKIKLVREIKSYKELLAN